MTYLRKNKLELIGHKTCKSMPDALKMKKKKKTEAWSEISLGGILRYKIQRNALMWKVN